MATYAKDIIQPAVASRTANDPGKLVDKPEAIRVLSRRLQLLYAKAAEANPWYFSVRNTVTPDGTKWARPAGGPVFYVYGGGNAGTGADAKLAGGTDPEANRVSIVPLRDFSAELAPRIYQIGRNFHSVGTASDPSASVNGDKLTFVSSLVHADLDPAVDWDHANNLLDSSWPEHHNNLLIAELERYYAKKDGRKGDLEAIDDDIIRLTELFVSEVVAESEGASTRWGPRHPSVSGR